MKIVFVSNYYNHHQDAVSKAFYRETNGYYTFLQTMEMDAERKGMGWRIDLPEYVCKCYTKEDEENYQELVNTADIVICGSARSESIFRQRMLDKKLVFRYSERIYRKNWQLLQLPLRALKYGLRDHGNPNVYLLCASAYASGDYAKTGFYKDKAYKWGYFPEVKRYEDIEKIIAAKRPASILWVARLIGLKHPGASIEVAKRLKQEGYSFELNLIGSGELEGELRQMIAENDLGDCVHLLGAMPPEKVREQMEQSEIFLFTSDRNEGWGAVLNESMNSGCAVVASDAIGSVPFLIENGKNGLVYQDGSIDDLTEKVKMLFNNPDKRKEIGEQAYWTMTEQWNAENAAERLIELVNAVQSGRDTPFADGICSKAEKR